MIKKVAVWPKRSTKCCPLSKFVLFLTEYRRSPFANFFTVWLKANLAIIVSSLEKLLRKIKVQYIESTENYSSWKRASSIQLGKKTWCSHFFLWSNFKIRHFWTKSNKTNSTFLLGSTGTNIMLLWNGQTDITFYISFYQN